MLVDHLLNIAKEFKILEEAGYLKHLYRNELGKACFAHYVAYPDSKVFAKKTISDKILKDRAYEIARNRNNDRYQRVLVSIFYKFFDMKIGSGINGNKQLAEKLHKPAIKRFKRRKVYARFKDNIWEEDEM